METILIPMMFIAAFWALDVLLEKGAHAITSGIARMRAARAKGESRVQPACARQPGGAPRPSGRGGRADLADLRSFGRSRGPPSPPGAAWQPAKVQGPFATARRGSPASRASRRCRPRHRSLMLGPCRPPPAPQARRL